VTSVTSTSANRRQDVNGWAVMCWRVITSVLLLSSSLTLFTFAQNPATLASEQVNSDVGSETVQLFVSNPHNVKVPEALADRILRNTLHAFARRLDPGHPPTIIGKVTLRLGEPGQPTIETLQTDGKEKQTVISMPEWNEKLFARMSARAARDNLLADADVDECARSGLAGARAIASVNELRHER
jgi:hypothetical protein